MDAFTKSDIYPSLTYLDARPAIDFLCRVFGFEQRLLVPLEEDGVLHSELSYGEGVVMISSAKPEQGRVAMEKGAARPYAMSVYVENPDAHFSHAVAEGAEIVRELEDEEYGARGYMAKDPEGVLWYFGNYRPGAWWDGKTGC